MRLRLRDDGPNPAAFGCSPAHELLRSLHVLAQVKRHPLHISWALRTRARMAPALRDAADRFGFWVLDRPLVIRDVWSQVGVATWDEELAALRAAPVEQLGEQLVHGALLHDTLGRRISLEVFRRDADLQRRALAQVEARHRASVPALQELVDDPERCRARFAGFLASYWEACLAPEWPELEIHLRDDIARRGRALSRRGLPHMLAELSPHIRLEPGTNDVLIRPPRPRTGRDELDITVGADDQILLVPTHFGWPELTTVIQRDLRAGREQVTVLVCYAVAEMQRQGQAPVAPQRLLTLLRSAGDSTRLQILRLLVTGPRSTRELAGLIGLTDAAISKHLKLLQDAGWVSAQRQSYYVYYRLERRSLTDLSLGLDEFLG